MYGPAVRCKRFHRSGRCGLASMYPASAWSVYSGPSWISARMRSDYRTGLDRAIWVTSVRMRREDRSSIVVSSSRRPRRANYFIDRLLILLCAVPLFVPGGRSFVPTCGPRTRRAQGPSRLAVAQASPLASVLPGYALTAPSTARGLRWTGCHRIGLDAREGAPLVENRPRDARKLIGQRNAKQPGSCWSSSGANQWERYMLESW